VCEEKKDEDENKNKMKWTTSPPSPKAVKSLSNDTTALEENLVPPGEAATVVECLDEWILGYK